MNVWMPKPSVYAIVIGMTGEYIPLFRDRCEAGRLLARRLETHAHRADVVVLALPRGGVPVAFKVAEALRAPMDVYLVRKLGVPGHEELAMGAIATGGVRILNQEVIATLGLTTDMIESVTRHEEQELARREETYRGHRAAVTLRDRRVILVDDGLATGSTMRAAVASVRRHGPARIIVAVPTGAGETCSDLKKEVDELVCAFTPEPFLGVGMWYEDFSQTSDQEVRDLLERAHRGFPLPPSQESARPTGKEGVRTDLSSHTFQTSREGLTIQLDRVSLVGDLYLPERASAIVVFAHGNGSSRFSPRNRSVAAALRRGGLATLLVDLLTEDEDARDARAAELRFDIGLLAERLIGITDWLQRDPMIASLPTGYFGASTGAGAALSAAAERAGAIRAVVSRGGRPDLAGRALRHLRCPTLLIVGGNDQLVLDLNREAYQQLSGVKELRVVHGASHLFEEEGALEAVTDLATDWFTRYLIPQKAHS